MKKTIYCHWPVLALKIILLFLFLGCLTTSVLGAAVYVKSGAHEGQGVAFSFNGRCLVVTAAHLIGEYSNKITISN